MKVFGAFAVCMMLMLNPVYAKDSWWTLKKTSFKGVNGKLVVANVLTIDATRSKLRIVSVSSELEKDSGKADSSLREFAQYMERKHKHYRNGEWIAVNGGFSSYRTDVPLGLLVVDGRVYSKVSKEQSRLAKNAAPSFQKYRWSGVLCQASESDKWEVLTIEQYKPGLCFQALQAGPILVSYPAKVAISKLEPSKTSPYERTAICLMSGNRIRLVFVSTPTHLFPLAKWLSDAENKGGLGCKVALNLSGEDSSGMAIRSPGNSKVTYVGDGSFPVPTVLVAEPR